jgi:dolichol-phosphate mannosyltransferase
MSITTEALHSNAVIALSIVIPCYNEADSVPRLAQQLTEAMSAWNPRIPWEIVFVDDGSRDDTAKLIDQFSSQWQHWQLVRHDKNRGLTAAILSGAHKAGGRWVAVLDADCTYSPRLLRMLFDRAQKGFDVVTASPYHAEGQVRNVARWRIALSRIASLMYGQLFRTHLTCYTACVRIYRRELLCNSPQLRFTGFVGITELLWHLERMGAKLAEVPATLHPRITGTSKMRTLHTAINHLKLMFSMIRHRENSLPRA